MEIKGVEENEIVIVATDSVADTERIKILTECIERLEKLNVELIQGLDQQSKLL